MKYIPFFLLLTSLSFPVIALDCGNTNVQATVNACAEEAYTEADKELNRVYKVIRSKITKRHQSLLTTAQRAWLKYRDSNCEHQAMDVENGSRSPSVYHHCLANVTVARTNELKTVYADFFTENVTTQPMSTDGLTPQHLVGHWTTLAAGYGMTIQFSLRGTKPVFSSFLNQRPFEKGLWQLVDGQLLITSEKGEQLYLYNHVSLKDNVLTLYEPQGGVEHYKRAQ